MIAAAPIDARLQPMSLDEWAGLAADQRGEIVDGYLVEEEVPDNVHEIVVMWLAHLLHAWGSARGAIVLGSGARFAIASDRGRMPDMSVFLPGSPRPPKHGLNRAPPSIAIEIVSSSLRDQRRDRVTKLREYALFRVRWYWIVDPELRSFQIHELNAEGRYEHAIDATDGHIESVPGCDGLGIDVSALWAEIDTLSDGD